MECESFSPNGKSNPNSNGFDNVRTALPLFNNQNITNQNSAPNFSFFNQQSNNSNSNGFFNNPFSFGSIQNNNQQQQQQQPSLFGQSTGFNFSFAPNTMFSTENQQQTGLFGQNLGFVKTNNDEDPEDPEFRPDEVAESESDDNGEEDDVEPEEGKFFIVELWY